MSSQVPGQHSAFRRTEIQTGSHLGNLLIPQSLAQRSWMLTGPTMYHGLVLPKCALDSGYLIPGEGIKFSPDLSGQVIHPIKICDPSSYFHIVPLSLQIYPGVVYNMSTPGPLAAAMKSRYISPLCVWLYVGTRELNPSLQDLQAEPSPQPLNGRTLKGYKIGSHSAERLQ